LEFYYSEVSSLRKAHDVSKAFEYPNEFYEFVYNLISELVIQENVKLTAIEHRAVSANWFLSPDFRAITISETTYTWLWRNLCLIVEKEKYVKKYWSTANQHFSYQLRRIDEIWNREGKIINESEVEKRDKERLVYLEFQYAFGGLLLYSKQFETIKYILSYTQSLPPDYVLLPKDMSDVFYWFEEFRNEFKERVTPIDLKFYFPGLDNLGNSRQVNYWICSFVTILFIRQFSLRKYYIYQDFTSLPKLPNSIIELNNWYEGISFFKKCLNDIISNSELISQLGYAVLLEKKEDELLKYADNLKIALKKKIGEEKLNAPISDEKIQTFNKKTAAIIEKSFDNYSIIHNTIEIYSPETVSYIKVKLNGYNSLFSKSAFTDNDISSLNYDSVLAEAIARETINYLIPGSFLTSRTNRYLLSDENIIEGIRKLKINKNEFVIVAINLYQHVEDKLDEYKEILLKVQSTNRKVQNTIFVLRKIDLPFIIHEDLPEKEIMENELIQINDELKLYTSVVELKGDEQNQNWEDIINPNDIEVNVKVSIAFLSYIVWKKDKKIVQINIETPYDEQGIPNSLDDIKPF
jgi:hypothetical protein